MSSVQLQVKRTDRQKKAWDALSDPVVRKLLYGGAKGGGKSHFLCAWLFTIVWTIMVAAELKPSKNPPHVAWFGRKQATDLTGTTMQTWREIIPEEYYELRGATEKDPKHILIAGRIAIDYGGLDKQENINNFNSAEYIIICVDQAEEVSKDDISVLLGSLRMVLKNKDGSPVVPKDKDGNVLLNPYTRDGDFIEDVADRKPFDFWPFKSLFTANPRQCWLKQDFILNRLQGNQFVSALPSDNPHLPSSYIQTLKDAFSHRPELLAAYMDGDWSAVEGVDQVIKSTWITEAKMRTSYSPRVKRYLICDYARFGDDECVIYLMDNAEIAGKKILGKCSTPDLVNRLSLLSKQNNDCTIVIEVIGADMGGAVADYLRELKHDVIEYNPGHGSMVKNAQGKVVYENVRAEAWGKAGKILQSGVLDEESNTLVVCKNMYLELENQLVIPWYKFSKSGDKVLIASKAEIKKKLLRSPDHADTYIIALWAWDQISYNDPDDEFDVIGYNENKARKRDNRSPMRMC